MDKPVSFRLPEELIEKMDIAARVKGVSRKQWLTDAIINTLEQGNKPRKSDPVKPLEGNVSAHQHDKDRIDWLVRLVLGVLTDGNKEAFEKLLNRYENLS